MRAHAMVAPAPSVAPKPIALVAGGSGLVGGQLLRQLCASPEFSRVVAISRRPLAYDHPKLANRIARIEDLDKSPQGVRADIAFCCLGTTMRTAGSEEAFHAVDHDLVVAFARAAKAGGVSRFVLLSAVGADSASKYFYLHVKGEAEASVAALGFASLDIVQPSLLIGWRNELRPFELAAMALLPAVGPLMIGKAERYRAIGADVVAAGMIGATRTGRKGITRYTYRALRELAAKTRIS
jgi:uncharacterized protein YbjT (DUF2867 family)